MKKLRKHLLILVSVLFMASCATIQLEAIVMPVQLENWKVGHAKDISGSGNIVEFVHQDESINKWSELITIQFMEGNLESVVRFMEQSKEQIQLKCPDTDWSILDKGKNAVLYEWSINDCPAHPDQHEISKLFRGNDGLHRIAFTKKTGELDVIEKRLWIDRLSQAYLQKDGKKVVIP